MVIKKVPGKAHTGPDRCAVVVAHGAVVPSTAQAGNLEAVGAATVDEGILSAVSCRQIEVTDVAELVVECAEHLGAQTQVQRQAPTHFPVILHEKSEIVAAVFVVGNTRTAEASLRGSLQEVLEIIISVGGWDKEQLAIEYLGKELVEVDARKLAAKPPGVVAAHPAQIVDKAEIVLRLILVSKRRGPQLKAGESELVDVFRDIVGWPVDTEQSRRKGSDRAAIQSADGFDIYQAVVDPVVAKSDIIHHRIRKQVGFIQRKQPVVDGEIQRKIQITCCDAGAQGSTQRSLQAACAERQHLLRIGKEEARRQLVIAAIEFLVPVSRELVIGEFAGLADDELPRGSRNARNRRDQVPSG